MGDIPVQWCVQEGTPRKHGLGGGCPEDMGDQYGDTSGRGS